MEAKGYWRNVRVRSLFLADPESIDKSNLMCFMHVRFRCVLTVTLGMATVTWYAISGHKLTDEQLEEEVRRERATKKSWKSVVASKFKSA
jgi:hypothetical protein